jgi:DNA-binding transcriptional regulator YiaG
MVRRNRIDTANDADSSMKNRKDSTRRPVGRGIPVPLVRLKTLSGTSSVRCSRGTDPDRGGAHVEFSQVHIVEIRYKFHATQRQFARMLGISLQTLRNWEQGKRRPHGPSRALLRCGRRTSGGCGAHALAVPPGLVARQRLKGSAWASRKLSSPPRAEPLRRNLWRDISQNDRCPRATGVHWPLLARDITA